MSDDGTIMTVAAVTDVMRSLAARAETAEAQLKMVLDREAATTARYDAKLDAAEARIAEAHAENARLLTALMEANRKVGRGETLLADANRRAEAAEAEVARLREWERHTVAEGMQGASRYWEGRWRDDHARAEAAEARGLERAAGVASARATDVRIHPEARAEAARLAAAIRAEKERTP